MAHGARPKKEASFKMDTKFQGKWYAEEDLKDKLRDKLLDKGIRDLEDIDDVIEAAYENNIKL